MEGQRGDWRTTNSHILSTPAFIVSNRPKVQNHLALNLKFLLVVAPCALIWGAVLVLLSSFKGAVLVLLSSFKLCPEPIYHKQSNCHELKASQRHGHPLSYHVLRAQLSLIVTADNAWHHLVHKFCEIAVSQFVSLFSRHSESLMFHKTASSGGDFLNIGKQLKTRNPKSSCSWSDSESVLWRTSLASWWWYDCYLRVEMVSGGSSSPNYQQTIFISSFHHFFNNDEKYWKITSY